MRLRISLSILLLLVTFLSEGLAQYNEPFIGEIRLVAFNYPPAEWAFCDGQLFLIEDIPALFSVLGTTYGGDGQRTFALPDLRGRSPVHVGQGPDLAAVKQGQLINGYSVKADENGTLTTPGLGMRYIIALNGTYPGRGEGIKERIKLEGRFTGEIAMFAGTFEPKGWANCDGQQLDVNDNKALFDAIGNTYGGTNTTFALPDLRGRVPVHAGRGPGLDPVEVGDKGDGSQFAIYDDFRNRPVAPSHLGIRYIIAMNGAGGWGFLGEVRMLAGKATPERDWSPCDGQILPIAQNSALFSLVGTTYGGDGRTTLGLPDLRGRAALHAGRDRGRFEIRQGEKTGSKAATADSGNTIQTQPTLGINYIIANVGNYPSRN